MFLLLSVSTPARKPWPPLIFCEPEGPPCFTPLDFEASAIANVSSIFSLCKSSVEHCYVRQITSKDLL